MHFWLEWLERWLVLGSARVWKTVTKAKGVGTMQKARNLEMLKDGWN